MDGQGSNNIYQNEIREGTNRDTSIKASNDTIETIFGNGPLNVAGFEKLGFKKFEKEYYKELEKLGEGACGTVMKALEIKNREIVALKEISLSKAESREKFLIQIESLWAERNINDQIRKHPNTEKYFAKVYGVYYDLDEGETEIKRVIMISEAGDYNLQEILNLKMNLMWPYTEEGALEIVRHLAEAYRILQKIGIYHCDTKLSNIMFSKSKNSYLVIDFGLSTVVRKDEFYKMTYFVKGGTRKYSSPEKKKFMASFREECLEFNPFKCDAWSLGICIKKFKEKAGFPENVREVWKKIEKLNEQNINERLDAIELCSLLEKEEGGKGYSVGEEEKKMIELLESKSIKKEGYKNLYEKYNDAAMYPELEKIAKEEFREQYEENKNNDQEIIMILWRLGNKNKFYKN